MSQKTRQSTQAVDCVIIGADGNSLSVSAVKRKEDAKQMLYLNRI